LGAGGKREKAMRIFSGLREGGVLEVAVERKDGAQSGPLGEGVVATGGRIFVSPGRGDDIWNQEKKTELTSSGRKGAGQRQKKKQSLSGSAWRGKRSRRGLGVVGDRRCTGVGGERGISVEKNEFETDR